MNKKNYFLLVLFSIIFLSFFMSLSSNFNGFATTTFDITLNVSDSNWVEDIPDTILLINSSTFVVDSDLSSQGNGQCNSQSTDPTFSIIEENTSKVDCEMDSDKLSITPAVNFTGNSSCEVRCSSSDFEDINFTIFVIETTDPEPETITTTIIQRSGGGGISQAQLAQILGQTNIINIAVNPESIKAKLFPGQGITEIISIENKLNDIYTIYPSKKGIVSYVNIKNEVVLQPNSISKIPVVITIPEDEYRSIVTGTINLDEFTDVAITIDVLNPLLLDSESKKVDLLVTLGSDYISPTLIFTGEIDKKNILPGTLLKPKLKLTDFFNAGYDEITLTYSLYDMSNNELFSFTEEYITDEDVTLNILLPEDLPLGKYALTFAAEYGDNIAKNTQTLEVVSERGIITDELLILTLIIGVLGYSIYVINRSRRLTN